jgi:hypothetical protein
MLRQLRDTFRRWRGQAPPPAAPREPDRSDGEDAAATQEEELREATTPGTPRVKTDNL